MPDSGEKLLYFLIGGFVGASVALLFAPRSGEETRQFLGSRYREGTGSLSRKVQEGRDYLSETGSDVSEKIGQTFERGRESVARQKEQISSAIEAGRRAYQEEKDKLGEEGGGEQS